VPDPAPAPAAPKPTPPTPASTPPANNTSSPATPYQSVAGDTYSQFNVGEYLTVKTTQTTQDNRTINQAVTNVGLKGGQEQKYLDSKNPVGAFILQMINLIALTAASLSFLAVVVAGFLMMSAAGNENQLNKGKEILSKAIIGLVITLSAYFIVAFVQNLLFETVSK
jgi:hypothetical protein